MLRGGLNLPIRDDHPDFPALVLANHLFGGSSVARVPARVREKEGLSYSTFTSFSSSAFDESATFRVSSIFAPQNRSRVEAAIREELVRAAQDGFTVREVDDGRKSLLESRRLTRSQDRSLAGRLSFYLFAGRTFDWDIAFESKIAALTPAEVNAAIKRRVHARDLAITMVATASTMKKLLTAAKVEESAIDVVPFESY